MLSLYHPVASCCLCTTLVFLASYLRRKQENPRGLPFPPGPRSLPIIGNLHQAPKSQDWLRYTDWGRLFGPLVHFRLFSQPVILVNTYEVAIDLFQKRSGIYSDRPRFVMAAELIGWDQAVALAQSGQRHRKCRRLLSNALNPVSAKKLWQVQESGSHKFLKRLEDDPQHFSSHIRASVSETIVMVAFGHECSAEAFPYVEMAESAHEKFTLATSPSAYVVDSLPLLRYLPEWFPGAGFKRQAREWNVQLQELVHFPYHTVKDDINKGIARPSYVSHHIDSDQPPSREDEDHVMWSAASLYTGGVDTTTAAVTTFILAMCLHPHVQDRAQRELDRVIGHERLPTISDRENLPYVEACMKEVLRWHPVAPLGVSHRTSKADYYDGYYIPKGATVVSNIWAMSRDPSRYPSPEEYRPERFLSSASGQLFEGVDSLTRTLATFNITKAKDCNGKVIEPEVEWVSGLISHPKPFTCSISVRSANSLQLVRAI